MTLNKEGYERKKRLSKANIIARKYHHTKKKIKGHITMKTLIVFVFAAMFFISSIHYGATAATTPNFKDIECFSGTEACFYGGDRICTAFCKEHKFFYGLCTPHACCCHIPTGSR
ncbi:hypothetical protein HID58_009430 [Brassica napus]|uniref:Uncharacterized protein n=1 Tax=Brassica napus TaxID=3708 RepID=A0ABQ8DSS8_BRANA|nr:hypothetical protein HID58_009430 [Brassica napus]